MRPTPPRSHRAQVLTAFVFLFSLACDGEAPRAPVTSPAPILEELTVRVSLAATNLIVGRTTQAVADALDHLGRVITGGNIVWSSSAPNVASVSLTGLVTAVTPGPVTIRAAIGNFSGGAPLTIVDQIITVRVTLASTSIIVGQNTQASATVQDQEGNTVP